VFLGLDGDACPLSPLRLLRLLCFFPSFPDRELFGDNESVGSGGSPLDSIGSIIERLISSTTISGSSEFVDNATSNGFIAAGQKVVIYLLYKQLVCLTKLQLPAQLG